MLILIQHYVTASGYYGDREFTRRTAKFIATIMTAVVQRSCSFFIFVVGADSETQSQHESTSTLLFIYALRQLARYALKRKQLPSTGIFSVCK